MATAHYGKFVASLESFLKDDFSERAENLKQANLELARVIQMYQS